MTAALFDLGGRSALVTGAASGLGRSIAVALAGAGADVAGFDLDADGLAGTGAEVAAAGGSWSAQVLDVTDGAAVRAAVAAIAAERGRIDILVANAGISDGPAQRLHETTDDVWRRVLDVNLGAVVTCARAVLPSMLAAGRGKIVNVASMWGLKAAGLMPLPAYAASKGAVVNLTREMALEYARDNVQVNAICPGFFVTNMGGGAYRRPGFAERAAAYVPMGRLAAPEEIRGAVLFLASDASSYVTGACLAVDGGCTAA